MTNDKVVGKINYNITRVQYREYTAKWDAIREVVEALTVVPRNRNDGWASIEIDTKENAGRAATAANTHARRLQQGQKPGWRIQTAVEKTETGALLYLRKVQA